MSSESFLHFLSLVCAQGSGPFLFLRELLTVEQRCDLRTTIYEGQVSVVHVMVGRWSVLARMVQRSLDCANNGFYGLSVQRVNTGNTGDTVTLRCSLTDRGTVRSLRSGVTARRFWRQIGCPKLVRANAMDIAGVGGRAGKKAGNCGLLPPHAEPTVSNFFCVSFFPWLR